MSTALRTYCRGAKLVSMRDEVAQKSFGYHFDGQGTVQCLTDGATGAVTDRFACDAWGVPIKRTGTSINRHWYIGNAGYYRQVSKPLDYSRERYLGNPVGRWLSADPVRARRPSVSSLYNYADNTPADRIDASGRATISAVRVPCDAPKGKCGAAAYCVKFVLPPPTNGRALNGWIVQHVVMYSAVADCMDPAASPTRCAGNKVPLLKPFDANPLEYWEAWPVKDGVVGDCNSVNFDYNPMPGGSWQDRFVISDHPDTCGQLQMTGHAQFFPTPTGDPPDCANPDLPGVWIPPPCRFLIDAFNWSVGNLWCMLEPPSGWADGSAASHSMQVAWNCCPGKCGQPAKNMTQSSCVPP